MIVREANADDVEQLLEIYSYYVINTAITFEYDLHIRCGNDQNIILRVPTIDLSPEKRNALNAGSHIRFTFSSKVAQLFDPATEKSLLWE